MRSISNWPPRPAITAFPIWTHGPPHSRSPNSRGRASISTASATRPPRATATPPFWTRPGSAPGSSLRHHPPQRVALPHQTGARIGRFALVEKRGQIGPHARAVDVIEMPGRALLRNVAEVDHLRTGQARDVVAGLPEPGIAVQLLGQGERAVVAGDIDGDGPHMWPDARQHALENRKIHVRGEQHDIAKPQTGVAARGLIEPEHHTPRAETVPDHIHGPGPEV